MADLATGAPGDSDRVEATEPEVHAETRLIRTGRRHQGSALAPNLSPSTTHVTPSVAEGRRRATTTDSPFFYGRYGNPTVNDFESAVAELEGAEAARAFSSGMGAISAVILGLCSQGDHVVAQRQLFGGTAMLFSRVCPRFGIEVTLVDAAEPGAFAAAVRPGRTMVVFAESPSNPQLALADLEELGGIAGPMSVVDSTFATPLGQRPLDHGVDLVIHSATKTLAGHNDAMLGVVAGAQDLIDWIWGFAVVQGANASPFDAMNGLRGLRTLAVRLERQSRTAQLLAEALEAHDAVTVCRYPGLESHPQQDLAKRQMAHMGGLLTFDIAGGLAPGSRFVEATRIAMLATSLGGPETLVTHPASTTHVGLDPAELEAAGISEGTIRVSVGLEHEQDVVADFLQALTVATD